MKYHGIPWYRSWYISLTLLWYIMVNNGISWCFGGGKYHGLPMEYHVIPWYLTWYISSKLLWYIMVNTSIFINNYIFSMHVSFFVRQKKQV